MEFTLLAAAAIGVGGFWLMLRWEAKRGNAAGCAVDLWDTGLTAGAAGLLIGRLTAMIQVGINPIGDPSQIILVRSGVSTPAAAMAAVLVFSFLARKSLLPAADAIGPSVLAGLAGWHLGTVITGSWLGTDSSWPWSQTATAGGVARHPVEIYAFLLYLAAAIGLALWKQKGHPRLGVPAGLALAAAGGVRLATEPMRVSLAGGPIWLYVAAVLVGLGLAAWASTRTRELGTS